MKRFFVSFLFFVLTVVAEPAAKGPGFADNFGIVELKAEEATLTQTPVPANSKINPIYLERLDHGNNIGGWHYETDAASWIATIPPGTYDVILEAALVEEVEGSKYTVTIGNQVYKGVSQSSGDWQKYFPRHLGTFATDKTVTVEVKVAPDGSLKKPETGRQPALMNLRAIRLIDPEKVRQAVARLMKCEEIVFAVRGLVNDGHWYANLGYYAQDPQKKAFAKGGQLCKYNLVTATTTVLMEDKEGGFRDPVVDYDGKTIVFSYRKGGEDVYHLYEIQSDGTGLRQLTEGIYDDFEPCFLPDGDLVFVSSRGRRWVNCWLTQVGILHRCSRDGKNIRQISANIEHDNTPWVLNDGRIIYQRWEYIDRSQVQFHHLWTANPDGTSQMVYFGNMHAGGVFIDAKPIPDSDRVVFIYSPGHGRREHEGQIATVTAKNGPDDKSSITFVTPGGGYRDPYALSKDMFLAASGQEILFVDQNGKTVTLFTQPKDLYGQPHEPRPLIAHEKEPIIPGRVDLKKTTGTLVVNNVYEGRNMKGITPGEIKSLLVMESLPKPINYTGSMEPMTYGGSFSLERILGTVPVENDGSAHFEAPANCSLFLIALDRNGSSVKRMQSFLTVMPGEVSSCVGCHEERQKTPVLTGYGNLLALKRPASPITPVEGIPDVFDYPRDIQPVWDRHCVKCHNPDKRSGGVLLTGDHGPLYSHSFYMLTALKQVVDGRNLPRGNHAPREIGDSASPLMDKLAGRHNKVKLSPEEIKKVRYWIHGGGQYLGTYAALGCGMIGTDIWVHQIDRTADTLPSAKKATEVVKNRCLSCHAGKYRIPNTPCAPEMWSRWRPEAFNIVGNYENKFLNHIIYNYSRPEKSVQLLAPLAKDAGGYGACRQLVEKDGKLEVGAKVMNVFASKDDPDYQILLKAIQDIKALHDGDPRWDTPGFIPPPEYVREMKRYGILPESLDRLKDPIDFYAADRAYWNLVNRHHPPGEDPKLHPNPKFKEMCLKGTLENDPKPVK